MNNKFLNLLVTGKGLKPSKARSIWNNLKKFEQEDPVTANSYLADQLSMTEMITLLKEYILCDVTQPKIKISREEFAEHFYVIPENNRGRKRLKKEED